MDLYNGWFTYDNYNVFSHVLMPYGLSVSLSFKDIPRGTVLHEALIGRKGADEEHLHPGMRSWDGTYTAMDMEYHGKQVRVETASTGEELVMLISQAEFSYVPLTLLVSASMLWNRPGVTSRVDETTLSATVDDRTFHIFVNGTPIREMNANMRCPFVSFALDKPVVVTVGTPAKSVEEVRVILDEAAAKVKAESARYGELAEAYEALRACMAWDTIYEPTNEQLCTPVSRIWNIQWGGYVLFCWDTFFSASMAALASKELAYANVYGILNEITENGFVPNFGSRAGTSRDRSQPPVGSMTVLGLYRKFGEADFVASVFDCLLTWNRWFKEHRMLENGTLCWGSEPFEPRYGNYWELFDLNCTLGGALESGLDNSPMYDDIPFDSERHIMKLADVGLTGLYIEDCEALAELAGIIGRETEKAKLLARAEHAKDGLDSLWNEKLGIYCNRRTDTGEFSTRLSPTMFYALYSDRVSDERVQRMLSEHFYNEEEFMGEYIMPSITRSDPAYGDQNYWRGRIWAPMNYLAYNAMKKRGLEEACGVLAEKSRDLLLKEWREHGHVHENYNGTTGEGDDVLNSDGFYHWGALLALIAIDNAGLSE